MVHVKCNQRFMMLLSFTYKVICFLAALVNIFFIFKFYFEYHVLIKVIPAIPFYMDIPKLSLCFDMTSVMDGRPQKEFFADSLDFFGQTVGELKKKMPQPENMFKHCSYRDWKTDSLVVKEKADCLEYFDVQMYPLQSYMCYKLTPRESNYSFFTVTNTLQARRFLYDVTPNSPLDEGHMILPILHFGEKPFLDRFYANEILTSSAGRQRYLVSYNNYELNSLPSPYETRCSLQSAAECFVRCMDKSYEKESRSFHRAIIFNDNDSLAIPNFVKDYEAIDSIYSATENQCRNSCPPVPGCHLSFTVTRVTRYSTRQKLVLEVQTLAKPGAILKTMPVMLLLELFTQLTSVCSFWLGFSVIGFCEKLQKCTKAKPSISVLVSLKMEANKLIRLLSFNKRLFSGRRAIPRKQSGHLIRLSFLLMKIVAAILFSTAIFSTLSQYFEYSTLTQITFQWNPSSSSNHAHLCFPLERMIGLPDMPDVTVANYDEVFMKKDKIFRQPLWELMNRTLKIEEILAGCRLWDKTPGTLWRLTMRPLQECLNHFIVSKYFAAGNICYSIGPKVKDEKWQESKIDLVQPGIFHSIVLQPALKSMTSEVMLAEMGDIPLLSRRYAAKVYPFGGKQLHRVSTRYREEHLLPSPYETDCNPFVSKYECLRRCLIYQTVAGTGYLPLSEIIQDSVVERMKDKMVISYTDLKNTTLMETWTRIEEECLGRCKKPGCVDDSTVTKVSTPSRSQVDFELVIGVRNEPDEISTTIPKTSLYWLYYQVFGCANFWLAFIILNANPFERWCERNEVERKLNDKISQFRLKLSRVVGVLRGRFEIHVERRKLISFHGRIRNQMSRFLCACGTITHIYLCVAGYLTYPTEVFIRRSSFVKTRNFSVMICNPLTESLLTSDFEAHYYGRITLDQLDERFDKEFNRSIADLVGLRPKSVGRIVGCSFRGLPPGFKNTDNENHITDRIYFRESSNLSICESIHKRKRLVIGGLICDRYDEGMKKKDFYQLLNEPDAMMGISTDRNVAGGQFSVVIGGPRYYPFISSLFSERSKLPPGEWWFDVSITEYRKVILGPPYDHDGLNDVSPYSCHRACLASQLSHFNLTTYSPDVADWQKKLPAKRHMRDPKIASIIATRNESCIAKCLLVPSSKTLIYYVTKVSRPLSGHRMKKDSVEFLLTVTKNPSIKVTFKAKWSFVELVIALGLVLNIWWGLSALGLDSSRANTDSLAAREIDECKRLITQMQLMLTAKPNVRMIGGTR